MNYVSLIAWCPDDTCLLDSSSEACTMAIPVGRADSDLRTESTLGNNDVLAMRLATTARRRADGLYPISYIRVGDLVMDDLLGLPGNDPGAAR